MTSLLRSALLIVLILVSYCQSALAAPQCRFVFTATPAKKTLLDIDRALLLKLRPLQSQAGMSEVDAKFQEWKEEAELLAAQQNRSVAKVMRDIIRRESSVGIHAFIDPDGVIRPDDGHHRILALLKAIRVYDLKMENFELKVVIYEDDDFRKKSWDDFGRALRDLGLGLLTPEQLAESKAKRESLGKRIQRLPLTFDQMTDSPVRSAVGHFFSILGLKGAQFQPAVQFTIGAQLENLGHDFAAGVEFTPVVQGAILAHFFSGSDNDLIQALIRLALSDQRVAVQEAIAKAKTRYERIGAAVDTGQFFDEDNIDDLDDANGALAEEPQARSRDTKIAYIMDSFATSKSVVLPNIILLPDVQIFYSGMFSTAQQSVTGADPSTIIDLVRSVKKGDIEKLTRADKKSLKATRKGLLKLRTAYRFFTEDHSAPDALDELSTILGTLNDQIAKWNERRMKNGTLKNTADEVLDIIKDNPDLISESNKPLSTVSDFVDYNMKMLKKIQSAIDGKKMTVGEYHWIRRRVREYAYFFQMLFTATGSPADDLMANMTSRLSFQMGKFKDGMVNSKSADKFQDPEDRPTKIDDVSKSLIERIVAVTQHSFEAVP